MTLRLKQIVVKVSYRLHNVINICVTIILAVRNQWSVWGPWSEPSTTGCPATRIKTRTCLVNTNVDTRNVTQTYPCSGLCTLDSMDSEEQLIIIERCTGSNTGSITSTVYHYMLHQMHLYSCLMRTIWIVFSHTIFI